MEDLKILVDIIKDLPSMGILLLAGYLFYKLIIVGSIFGIVRQGLLTLNSMITDIMTAKHKVKEQETLLKREALAVETASKRYDLLKSNVITSDDTMDRLMAQINRLRNKDAYRYIRQRNVEWLRKAIDNQQEADKHDEKN